MDRPMRARQGQPPAYAGLRPRLAAFALDYILIAGYLVLVVAAGALVRLVAPGITSTLFGNPFTAELTGFITVTLPVILYFAVSEASRSEATWGKRRRHLCVQGTEGRRLGLPRSLLRSAVKFAPWELSHAAIWHLALAGPDASLIPTLMLVAVWLLVGGYLLSIHLDRQNRAPYDRIAGSRVIRGYMASSG